MGSCMRCGATLADYEISHDGLCMNCASASSGHGTGTDVPCQRCGMYLPETELKMWNSRLFCNYCIMDIQDEEKMMRAGRKDDRPQENVPEGMGRSFGTCEKCGRQSDTLYTISGRRLCSHCAQGEGGIPPQTGPFKPALLARVIKNARHRIGSALSGKKEPVPIEAEPTIFDIRTRRLVAKRDELRSQQPLEEKKQGEKVGKPSVKSKKSFFGLLGGKKKED